MKLSGDDVVTGSSDKAAKLFSGLEMGSMHRAGIDPFFFTYFLPFAFKTNEYGKEAISSRQKARRR